MSYIGIGSPIPDISSLPGQTGGEIEVTLDYPSAAVCNGDDAFSPSSATPPGGTFGAEPSGLNINPSTGVVTPVGSTPQAYTISYTVSGVTSQFALTINNVEQSTFSYSASSFQQIGTATPTLASGTTSGGTFSASTGVVINTSTGVIDLAASTIGGPYTITYTTPGACSTSSTFTLSITAVAVELIDNDFAMEFNGVDQYLLGPKIGFGTGDFSISLWIKYSYGTGNERYNTLVDFRETAYNVNGLAFYLFENKAVVYIGGVGTIGTSTITLSQNLWTNIILTKTSGEYKVYFSDVNSLRSEVLGTNTTSLNEKTANIGIEWDESFGAFNGDMDEIAMWSRALEATDVQRIYNATANNPGKTANLFTAGLNTGLVYWNRMGD